MDDFYRKKNENMVCAVDGQFKMMKNYGLYRGNQEILDSAVGKNIDNRISYRIKSGLCEFAVTKRKIFLQEYFPNKILGISWARNQELYRKLNET